MLASGHINQPTTGGRSQFVQVLVRLSYYDITPRPATPYLVKTLSTATVTEGATILRLHKMAVLRLLHTDGRFAELFTTYLLYRNIRFEEALVDKLFNSSEKRLARILLLLSNSGREGWPEPMVPKISQEMLARMVGTTRSRVSHFMNKFRKFGFIDYEEGLLVHSSLLNKVLEDHAPTQGGGEAVALATR